ncbi:MAG: hypothetical protein AB8B55_04770, partial [Mariniblastus sp.]
FSKRTSNCVRTLPKKEYRYGSLLKILKKKKKSDTVNTRLVVNAVPKLGRTYAPDEFELPLEKSDKYVAQALPELFRDGDGKQAPKPRINEEIVGATNAAIKEQNSTRWSRMSDWLSGE